MSLYPLLAAVVASGTALWVAYKVYPLQKAEDRRVKLAEEKAEVYRNFFDVADDYHETSKLNFNNGKIDDFGAHFVDLNKAQRALLLYAPGCVIAACNAYADCLRVYRYAVRKEVDGTKFPRKIAEVNRATAYHDAEKQRNDALIHARLDLLGGSLDDARKAVQGIPEQHENEQARP